MTETATFHAKNSGENVATDRKDECECVGTMEHTQWGCAWCWSPYFLVQAISQHQLSLCMDRSGSCVLNIQDGSSIILACNHFLLLCVCVYYVGVFGKKIMKKIGWKTWS